MNAVIPANPAPRGFRGFPPDSPWMSENQVAKLFGMNRQTLTNWRARGFIPAHLLGDVPREKSTHPVAYSRAAIQQLVDAGLTVQDVLTGFTSSTTVTDFLVDEVKEPLFPEDAETGKPPSSSHSRGARESREGSGASVAEGRG
jgi:hypothetical protein